MSQQTTVYRQQTEAGEIQAANIDLLRAVTQLVERQRPTIEDLIAAVTLAWADDAATA